MVINAAISLNAGENVLMVCASKRVISMENANT
jgi:hypothetical protein